MVERRKPIVTELALADALGQLVNLIEELRVDVDLRVEITTDDTQLRWFATSGTRASATTRPRTAPATPSDVGHAAARTLRASAVQRNT